MSNTVVAEQLGVPLLGSIPLDPAVAAGGDTGEPVVIAASRTPAAQAFAALAERIVTEAIPLVEMVACTARQFFKSIGHLTPMPQHRPTTISSTPHLESELLNPTHYNNDKEHHFQ